MILKRSERYRTISTRQRYGDDLEETTLRFDPQTRVVTIGESKEHEEGARIGEGIIAFLEAKGEPVTEAEIDEEVEGKTGLRRKALRDLVKVGIILRSGRGGKNGAYRYATAQTQANSAGNKNPAHESPENTDRPPEASNVVPLFPDIYREQENKNPESSVSMQKHEPDSCSRDFGTSPDVRCEPTDAGNKNPDDTPARCRGCKEPFEPLTDGASKTLCRACQAELRRGLRR
jgi:hypothetical protein